MDPDSGEIKSIRPLANKAAEQAYALKIVAFDHGSPRRSSEVNVMIKIRPQIPDASGAQIIEPSVGTNIRLEEVLS